MPNYVYSTIELAEELTAQQGEVLKKIEKAKGIARYYVPMPSELANSEAVYPETEKNIELKEKYGYTSWYPWAKEHWGTKWGCCGFKIDGNIITFSTAWSPLKQSIIERFAKDFPNFEYSWEEEQGFGESHQYIDGECHTVDKWDMPEWGEHPEVNYTILDQLDMGYLTQDYPKMGVVYKQGFYSSYNLDSYISNDHNSIVDSLNRLERQYHEAVRTNKWYLAPDMGITVLEEDDEHPDLLGIVKSARPDDHRCKFVMATHEGLVHFDGRSFYTDYDQGIKSLIPACNWYDWGFVSGYNNFCTIENKLKLFNNPTFPNKNAEESYNRGVADGMQERYITG